MSDNQPTLADFFDFDAQDVAKTLQRSRAVQNKSVPGGLRAAAAQSLAESAQGFLEEPVAKVLGSAWGKLNELRQLAADQSNKTHDCTLHEHEVSLSRKPAVELLVNGAPTGITLEFEMKLAMTISSAVLKVQQGKIIGVNLGKLKGHGVISCIGLTLAKRETSAFKMPGKLAFTPGIEVR